MLSAYSTLVFDCDGVILNSNRIKTEAFRRAAQPYGVEAAQKLVDHHIAHGGVSRYKKFQHFLDTIVLGTDGPRLDELLISYASFVRQGLMTCDVTEGLEGLRAALPGIRWMIVSGGDQLELRGVFAARGLDKLFDGGIFGSPDSKDKILARELQNGSISKPALFLGDSKYDHIASAAAGLDFLFISAWSEFSGWKPYLKKHQLIALPFVCSASL